MKKVLMALVAGVVIGVAAPSIAQNTDTKVFISGTVVDDPGMLFRMPLFLENVKVRLWRIDIAQLIPHIVSADDSAITDSSGNFKLTAVSAVSYKVTFEHNDFISTLIDVTTSRDTSVTVQMSRKEHYSGNKLIVTPLVPSTKDSILFELTMSERCCATVYRDHNVDVTDTSVVLNYTFDDRLCLTALCLTNISSTTFVSKPIKAGMYKVYKCGQYYCPPGSACPTIYYPPVLVGTITVTNGTGTERVQLPKKIVPYVISRNQLQFSGIRNAHLSIDCYTLSGVYAGSLYNGIVQSDNVSVSLDNKVLNRMNQKTVILRIARDGVVVSELLRK
ncbi:MAG: carboxypeptidase-like regulatory domain-containing protein [Fibrobacterota bacterium]|nr:carboxypeptidase-like regulatory domain-containing protein [Chitinispirillaceae bacterium]